MTPNLAFSTKVSWVMMSVVRPVLSLELCSLELKIRLALAWRINDVILSGGSLGLRGINDAPAFRTASMTTGDPDGLLKKSGSTMSGPIP